MRPIHPHMPVSPLKLPSQLTRRASSECSREELASNSRLRSPQPAGQDALRKRKYSGEHDARSASALSPPASLKFVQRGNSDGSRPTPERRPSFTQVCAPMLPAPRPAVPAEPAAATGHLKTTSHAAALTDALNRLNIGAPRDSRPAPAHKQEWPRRGRRSRVPSHEDQIVVSSRGRRNGAVTPISPASLGDGDGVFHMDSDDEMASIRRAQPVYDLFAARK